MTTDAESPPAGRTRGESARAAAGAVGAAVLGAAPHVLHHAGPLAGAALVAGATGTIVFGLLALLLTIPMLRRLRRRTGSWRAPAALLVVMAAMFTLSSAVIGPALSGDEDDSPAQEHDSHHP